MDGQLGRSGPATWCAWLSLQTLCVGQPTLAPAAILRLAPHPSPAHQPTGPHCLQANGSVYPSPSDFTYKLALDEPNRPFNLSLCAAQVRAGQWVAAVYNPLPSAPLGFNLTVHKIGRCLRNCSNHGR